MMVFPSLCSRLFPRALLEIDRPLYLAQLELYGLPKGLQGFKEQGFDVGVTPRLAASPFRLATSEIAKPRPR